MRWFLTSLFLVLGLGFGVAHADQNDARLPSLFDELSKDLEHEQVRALEMQIWSIWLDSGDGQVDHLMQRGMVAVTMGGYRQAIHLFTEIVEMAPDYAEGWNKRATVFYLIGHHQESIEDVEQTLSLEPRHFGAIAGLGLNLEALGAKQEAIDAYRAALEVNPHLKRIRSRLQELEAELKDDAI